MRQIETAAISSSCTHIRRILKHFMFFLAIVFCYDFRSAYNLLLDFTCPHNRCRLNQLYTVLIVKLSLSKACEGKNINQCIFLPWMKVRTTIVTI